MENDKKGIGHYESLIKMLLRLLMEGDKRLVFILEKSGDELQIQFKTEAKTG